MKKILMTLLCFSLFTGANAQKPSDESVKQLMEITGAANLGVQGMNKMLEQLKPMMPKAPESFWVDIRKEFTAQELIDIITPIYQKHLTQEEVDAVSKFYQTPIGKSFIEAQPAILNESMEAGEKWGARVAEKIFEKYQAEFPDK